MNLMEIEHLIWLYILTLCLIAGILSIVVGWCLTYLIRSAVAGGSRRAQSRSSLCSNQPACREPIQASSRCCSNSGERCILDEGHTGCHKGEHGHLWWERSFNV